MLAMKPYNMFTHRFAPNSPLTTVATKSPEFSASFLTVLTPEWRSKPSSEFRGLSSLSGKWLSSSPRIWQL